MIKPPWIYVRDKELGLENLTPWEQDELRILEVVGLRTDHQQASLETLWAKAFVLPPPSEPEGVREDMLVRMHQEEMSFVPPEE